MNYIMIKTDIVKDAEGNIKSQGICSKCENVIDDENFCETCCELRYPCPNCWVRSSCVSMDIVYFKNSKITFKCPRCKYIKGFQKRLLSIPEERIELK